MAKISLLIAVIFLCSLLAPAQNFETTIKILPQPSERYFYQTIDVPANVESISIEYSYDNKDGLNILDLGVFDSAFDQTKASLKGFRGWSGGRRNVIFIDRKTASNGYIPGKIPAGKWQVIFGLYKVAPEGVEVKLMVWFNKINEQALTEFENEKNKTIDFNQTMREKPEKSMGYTWFRGDLHTHTFHSDGNWTVKGIFDFAFRNNLDFVAITEHNTFSHHSEINAFEKQYPDLLILRGEEVTSYGGHFNVWGLPAGEIIDFRIPPQDKEKLEKSLAKVRRLKIPASINHPTAICGGCSWTYGDDWTNMTSVEIWNGAWDFTDEQALAKWDALLQKGARITAIGSSDSHRVPAPESDSGSNPSIGNPATFIGAKKLEQTSLFQAITASRVFIADDAGKFIAFSSGNKTIGDTISAKNTELNFSVGAENFPVGAILKIISGGIVQHEFPITSENRAKTFSLVFSKNNYVRVEIRDKGNKMLAMTNPIFVEVNQ